MFVSLTQTPKWGQIVGTCRIVLTASGTRLKTNQNPHTATKKVLDNLKILWNFVTVLKLLFKVCIIYVACYTVLSIRINFN